MHFEASIIAKEIQCFIVWSETSAATSYHRMIFLVALFVSSWVAVAQPRKKLQQELGVVFNLQFSSEIDPALRSWCTKHYDCSFSEFHFYGENAIGGEYHYQY